MMNRGIHFAYCPDFNHIYSSWRCDQVKSEESQQNRHPTQLYWFA